MFALYLSDLKRVFRGMAMLQSWSWLQSRRELTIARCIDLTSVGGSGDELRGAGAGDARLERDLSLN
jgi:hypothetical protein